MAKVGDYLPIILLAAGAYLVYTNKDKLAEAAAGYTAGAVQAPLYSAVGSAIPVQAALGNIPNVAQIPSQIWNAATGNQSANQMQAAAADLNRYLQQQTGTATPYVQAVTGSTGITTVTPTAAAANAAAAISRAIESATISSANFSLASGGTAYIPPSQAVVNASNAKAHATAGTISASTMSTSQRAALGLM